MEHFRAILALASRLVDLFMPSMVNPPGLAG